MSLVEREQRIFRAAPVVDRGIDLRVGKPNGVKGYDWTPTPQPRITIPTHMPYPDKRCSSCRPLPVLFVERKEPAVAEIQQAISVLSGLRMTELKSARRARHVCDYRQLAMMLTKLLTTKSLPEIGRRFGGRDHTTVLHAVRKFEPVENHLRKTMADHASVMDWAVAAVDCARKTFHKFGEPSAYVNYHR